MWLHLGTIQNVEISTLSDIESQKSCKHSQVGPLGKLSLNTYKLLVKRQPFQERCANVVRNNKINCSITWIYNLSVLTYLLCDFVSHKNCDSPATTESYLTKKLRSVWLVGCQKSSTSSTCCIEIMQVIHKICYWLYTVSI